MKRGATSGSPSSESTVFTALLDEPAVAPKYFNRLPTTARERGSDFIDLQDFAGHADPRTTLTYIRNCGRLSNSPAYVLRY